MEWIKDEGNFNVPVKSWCKDLEDGAMAQAADLAKHPVVFRHVALMPDCHQGYGMPIGGVIACTNAVIPNAVGVDIGCGMGQVGVRLAALGHKVVLCDISKKMLLLAEKQYEEAGAKGEVEFVHSSVQALDQAHYPPFDIVLFHAVLEWVAEPKMPGQL